MKPLVLTIQLLSGLVRVCSGQGQPQSLADDSAQIVLPKAPVLLANGNLIDVETGKSREGVSLLIENGIIRKIGKNLAVPAGATVIDAKGKWLMPGLIDSHIHLFQSGGLYTRPDGIDLTRYRPYETERKWLRDNMGDFLRRYLACGITTVIDVGGPMYQFAYRDRFNQRLTSPQILLTGPLTSTYQPPAFNIVDSPILKANTPEEAREQVRRQLPYKPDLSRSGLSCGALERVSRRRLWSGPLSTKRTKPDSGWRFIRRSCWPPNWA